MGRERCGKKEKLFVMSNFPFSHSVFKRLVLQTCKNQGLFGKQLNITNLVISVFDRPENNAGKGENVGYQHFLFFSHNIFKSLIILCSWKFRPVLERVMDH